MPTSPLNVVLALPRWFTQRPIQPMGLMYLASVLRRGGHRVRIIDGEVERIDHDSMAAIVAAERPESRLGGNQEVTTSVVARGDYSAGPPAELMAVRQEHEGHREHAQIV